MYNELDKELFDLNKMSTTELIQKRAELAKAEILAKNFKKDIEEHLIANHPDGIVKKGDADKFWSGKGKVVLKLDWNIKTTTIDTEKLKRDGLYNKYTKHGVRKQWNSVH